MKVVYKTNSEAETEALGRQLSADFRAGDVIALTGDLGAGKTCLVRGVAKGLGSRDLVNSPTFTIINQYQGRLPIYHFDVYRLNNCVEMEDLDMDDYLFGQGLCVIEWAEKAEALLPDRHWSVTISIINHKQREIVVKYNDKKDAVE